jgi:hypothetical protein
LTQSGHDSGRLGAANGTIPTQNVIAAWPARRECAADDDAGDRLSPRIGAKNRFQRRAEKVIE